MATLCFILGTRPEAVKLAPIIAAVDDHPDLHSLVISTGQHREMLQQVFDVFGIAPDIDLDLFEPGQSVQRVISRTIERLADAVHWPERAIVVVQGDTAATFAGALAAFLSQVPIVHVEAGLRTDDRYNPFPEEMNRRLVTRLADLHLAATDGARGNLLKEGTSGAAIYVTGNTVIDALVAAAAKPSVLPRNITDFLRGGRTCLMTLHRRESWGEPIRNVAIAMAQVLEEIDDARLLVPMHRNPIVRAEIREVLGGHPRAMLVDPLDYFDFVHAMKESYFLVTDSGGVQEEAPSLGKPVLVCRENTERPEGIDAGTAVLVGTDVARVSEKALLLLRDADEYRAMSKAVNPYGDGTAAVQSLEAILEFFHLRGAA